MARKTQPPRRVTRKVNLALAGTGLGLVILSQYLFPALAIAGWALFLYGTCVIALSWFSK